MGDDWLDEDLLLTPSFRVRLEALLERAALNVGAKRLEVIELTMPRGQLEPSSRGIWPRDEPPSSLSISDVEVLRSGSAKDAPGLAEIAACISLHVTPPLAPGIDAFLLAWGTLSSDRERLLNLAKVLERGLSEDRAQRLGAALHQAIERAQDPIEITDDHARLVFVNEAWQRFSGVPRNEALQRTVAGVFRDHEIAPQDDIWSKYALSTLNRGQSFTSAVASRNRHGQHVFAEISVSPFDAADHGFKGQFSVRRDLSHRFARDDALSRAHEEIRLVLEAAPDGVVVLQDGRIYFANTAFFRLVADVPERVIGKTYVDFIDSADRQLFAEQRAGQITGLRIQTALGTTRFVEVSIAGEVSFEGFPARILICRDTTDHRMAQEQLASSERLSALGALAAGVAHEINNPLTYVTLNLERLSERLDGRLSAAEREALDDALDGARRIQQVAGELREFSGSKGDTPRAPVEVMRAVATAIGLTQNEIRHRVELSKSHEAGLYVNAWESELVQVVSNLLLNAAQAVHRSARGHHTIAVRTAKRGRERVEITVKDNGVGIEEEKMPQIFQPFLSNQDARSGYGLGLAISRRIVQRLGGEILIESALGQGTTVRVILPRVESPVVARDSSPVSGIVPSEPAEEGAARVLIIDDEPAVAKGIKRFLVGYNVEVMCDSPRALERLLRGATFDVILCDLMMPGVSGADLFLRVVAVRPELRARFLFMTGGRFTHQGRRTVEAQGATVLDKPLEPSEVLQRVQKAALRARRPLQSPDVG